jgi:hypothetical protein
MASMRWVVLVLCLALAKPADGAPCAVPSGATYALAQRGLEERYRFMMRHLLAAKRRGAIWTHTWGWTLTAATVSGVGLGVYALRKRSAGEETSLTCPACSFVGAAKSTLGVINTFVLAPAWLPVSPHVSSPTCQDLAVAEGELLVAYRVQETHFFRHVLETATLNAAGAVYLGVVHDQWRQGLIDGAIGFTIGQIIFWTRPRGARSAYRSYLRGELGGDSGPKIHPVVTDLHGVSVIGTF